ncbi:MAG TPA: MaoC family dehydratase [Acidimicrobiales bacterium]|nr:MaoC family dehydratase [Acidimicrobiales bacterium]
MAATTVSGVEELRARVGEHLGYTEWMTIDQERVNLFADATGDHQWIHVDPERAKKESPFGGPIAHGFLTLSLIPDLIPRILVVEGVKLAVNYGCDRVRFPAPVPVGADVRMGAELQAVDEVGEGVSQVKVRYTIEVRDAPKPSCVADVLFRYYT